MNANPIAGGGWGNTGTLDATAMDGSKTRHLSAKHLVDGNTVYTLWTHCTKWQWQYKPLNANSMTGGNSGATNAALMTVGNIGTLRLLNGRAILTPWTRTVIIRANPKAGDINVTFGAWTQTFRQGQYWLPQSELNGRWQYWHPLRKLNDREYTASVNVDTFELWSRRTRIIVIWLIWKCLDVKFLRCLFRNVFSKEC